MRQHRGIPDHERFSCLPAPRHEVVNRLHRLAADRKPVVAVPRTLRHALGESTPGKIPLPPFSGLQGLVAVLAQQAGERRPRFQVPVHPFAAGRKGGSGLRAAAWNLRILRWIVAHDPVLVRIAAGDDRRQARAAEAARHVAPRVHEALPRKPVEMRRPQVRMSHERIVTPVLVVGDDADDVAGDCSRRHRRFSSHRAAARSDERRDERHAPCPARHAAASRCIARHPDLLSRACRHRRLAPDRLWSMAAGGTC